MVTSLSLLVRRLLFAAAVLACGAGATLAEDAVLLSSTAPGQSPGAVIADGASLSLPDGTSATLLFRSGQMLKLRGPFDGPLRASDDAGSAAAVASALRMQGVDASVVGGSRDIAPSARRAMDGQEISIDPRRSAAYCIGGGDTLWLRRPAEAGHSLGLRHKGSLRMVFWPAGAPQIEWPDDVIIEDGDRFEVVDDAGKATAALTFHRLDPMPRSETAWLARTMLLGCGEQAEPALREAMRSSVPPELYLASDRGRHPVYHVGETMQLVVQSNRDGHLYCFLKRRDGTTVPIFPAGAAGGAWLEGHAPLSIPGPRSTTAMRAGTPPGVDEIRCYLADRDLDAELPAPLLAKGLAPLPDELADSLDAVFAAAPMARIVTSGLSMRIE